MSPLPPLGDATLALGRRAMTGLLGVDALYRSESGDGDGLAVLNMDLEGAHPPEAFASYGDAEAFFQELRRDAARLPEPDRRVYYDQLCHSTLAFTTWRRAGLAFQRQLGDFLHVPAAPASTQELDSLRADLHELLDGLGYAGDLASQCRAWEERNRVLPEDVPGILGGLLDEAWGRTEERLLPIPAPRSDGMRVAMVTGVAYNARCDYLARTIELNVDPVLTRPALKHLAVHEGYPGHYVQFKLRETSAREGTAPADVLLSVVNTASSSVFEGIADAGMEALGWVESDDDRIQSLMNRYRAGIGTGAAWLLHAVGRPEEEVADWLRARSLVGGEGWVRNRMRFIAAPSRAALIWSYWWGERSVAPLWRRVPADRREDFARWLYGRMHSNDSVGMFS
ncbi:MAG: hypothetical protein Q8N53_22135 [Longimicrobiales bacterium]|nr:hypothetical protein [Longimicrobiales bacterium]